MKYVYLALNWILGVLFLLAGLYFIINAPFGGLSLVAIALLLLPPVRGFTYSKTKKNLSVKQRWIIISVFFVAFSVFWQNADQKAQQELARKEAGANAKMAAVLKRQRISYFNHHYLKIISETRNALQKGNYQKAISLSSKYLPAKNPELLNLNHQAKSKLAAIEQAKKAAEAAREKLEAVKEKAEQQAKEKEERLAKEKAEKERQEEKRMKREKLKKEAHALFLSFSKKNLNKSGDITNTTVRKIQKSVLKQNALLSKYIAAGFVPKLPMSPEEQAAYKQLALNTKSIIPDKGFFASCFYGVTQGRPFIFCNLFFPGQRPVNTYRYIHHVESISTIVATGFQSSGSTNAWIMALVYSKDEGWMPACSFIYNKANDSITPMYTNPY